MKHIHEEAFPTTLDRAIINYKEEHKQEDLNEIVDELTKIIDGHSFISYRDIENELKDWKYTDEDINTILKATMNTKKNLMDKIEAILNFHKMRYEIYTYDNKRIGITIRGDWKHDHLYFENLMKFYSIIPYKTKVIDDCGGGDFYKAVYFFKNPTRKNESFKYDYNNIGDYMESHNIKKLTNKLNKMMEELGYGNTNKEKLSELRPGLYISRLQQAVCHDHYPDHWQYFGPYETPKTVQRYHSRWGDDNEKHYTNGPIKEIDVKCDFTDYSVKIKGQLVKTWEEFEEEYDNIHHHYGEEYKILEVL